MKKLIFLAFIAAGCSTPTGPNSGTQSQRVVPRDGRYNYLPGGLVPSTIWIANGVIASGYVPYCSLTPGTKAPAAAPPGYSIFEYDTENVATYSVSSSMDTIAIDWSSQPNHPFFFLHE